MKKCIFSFNNLLTWQKDEASIVIQNNKIFKSMLFIQIISLSFIIIFYSQKSAMFMMLLVRLTFVLSGCRAATDFICNGNFQVYIIPGTLFYSDGSYVQYGFFFENSSCWYRVPSGIIKVQTPSYAPSWTKVVQIIDSYIPYTLCQKVNISVGLQYSLSFDVVKPKPVASATASLFVNNVFIKNVTSTDYLISSKLIYNFTANVSIHQICINGSYVISNSTRLYHDDFSPLIDNVSLVQILEPQNISQINTTVISNFNNSTSITNQTSLTNQTSIINSTSTNNSFQNNIQNIYVSLQLIPNQEEGSILFLSTSQLTQWQFNILQKNGKTYIQGQEQKKVNYFYDENTSLFNITVFIYRDYDLQAIYISFPEEVIHSEKFRLVASINGKDVIIYLISQKMISVSKTMNPISAFIIDGINKFYSMLKLTFCSYFIMNIVNFYSLTLMYNFLGLPAQPVFSRATLEKLSLIFYKRNSLFGYIQSIFSLPELDQNLQFSYFMNDNEEKVDKFYKKFSWLGNMGITSNFLANNAENIAMIIFLILKLSLLTLFQKAFPHFSNKILGGQNNFVFVFISQVVCISPLMTVSAFSTISNSGCTKVSQTGNIILHIVLQFTIILCPFLYLFKMENKRERMSKRKRKMILMKFTECLLNVLLPALIVIKNQIAFFVVISSYFILLLSSYFYSFTSYSYMTRVYKSAMVFILVVHHFSFMLIYLVGIFNDKFGMSLFLNQSCKIAGMIVIFTILCGGLGEILYFVANTIYKTFKNIKKCFKNKKLKFKNKNQKSQKSSKKQQKSQKRSTKIKKQDKEQKKEYKKEQKKINQKIKKKIHAKMNPNYSVKQPKEMLSDQKEPQYIMVQRQQQSKNYKSVFNIKNKLNEYRKESKPTKLKISKLKEQQKMSKNSKKNKTCIQKKLKN